MEGQHRIAIHSTETLESGETYDHYRFVDFADPENDPQSIDNGEIDELVFVGEDEILSMMNEAGAGGMNFGNYLWGATGYTVGLGRLVLQGGTHFNSVFGARFNGYESQLDSKDDQLSIRLGARRAKSNNYKKYRR